MKKLILLFSTVIFASMYSCIDQRESAYLYVSKAVSDLTTPNDTSFMLKLLYSNDWTVESLDSSWCRVTPTSGKGRSGTAMDSVNLNVVVDKNTTDKMRQTVLRISSVNLVIEPIIRQAK